jgi:hypothetical protein
MGEVAGGGLPPGNLRDCWCGAWSVGADPWQTYFATLQEPHPLGVGFVSLSEALNLTTPAGRAMATLLAVFSEIERDIPWESISIGTPCKPMLPNPNAWGPAGTDKPAQKPAIYCKPMLPTVQAFG